MTTDQRMPRWKKFFFLTFVGAVASAGLGFYEWHAGMSGYAHEWMISGLLFFAAALCIVVQPE